MGAGLFKGCASDNRELEGFDTFLLKGLVKSLLVMTVN